MAECQAIGLDYGGTGVRAYTLGPDDEPFLIDRIPLVDPTGSLQERTHRLLRASGLVIGAVVHAVDGSDIGNGVYHSFKADEDIDPALTAEVFGCPSEGMNDVEAIAWNLGGLAADQLVKLVDNNRNVSPLFPNRSTVAATVSSGYGTALRRIVGDYEQITSLHGGHVGFQALGVEEDAILQGIRQARKSNTDKDSDIVTVEEVIAGAQVMRIAEILTPSYADKLESTHNDTETDFGLIIAQDATLRGVKDAIRIMQLRAGVLGTAVRDSSAQHEVEAFALTGGSLPGLLPWLKDQNGLFARRIRATRPSHAYTPPDVFAIPDGSGAQGALRRAAQLMDAVR
ncbi:MAG TPA: glucokinase [Candidatus Saccharimonadia bacterium]|nr:glucokinase [Candidatus Saccharimonadia bacterium]